MDNEDKTQTNKILILKILSNIEQLKNDFKEIKDELKKNNNEYINIETSNKIDKEKKSGWFF